MDYKVEPYYEPEMTNESTPVEDRFAMGAFNNILRQMAEMKRKGVPASEVVSAVIYDAASEAHKLHRQFPDCDKFRWNRIPFTTADGEKDE